MKRILLSLIVLIVIGLAAFQYVPVPFTKAGGGAVYFTPVWIQNIPSSPKPLPIATSSPLSFGTSTNLTAGYSSICWAYANGSATALTISDTQTNTFTNLVNNASVTAGGVWSAWIVNSEKSSATDTFSIVITGTFTQAYGTCTEVEDLAASSFDQGPATATGLSSNAVTPSISTEFELAITVGGNGGTAPAAGSGWTLIGASNAGPTNPGAEYRIITGGGSQTAVFTAGTGTLQTSILTFEAHTNP